MGKPPDIGADSVCYSTTEKRMMCHIHATGPGPLNDIQFRGELLTG